MHIYIIIAQLHVPIYVITIVFAIAHSWNAGGQHQHAQSDDFGLTTIAPLSRLYVFILCIYLHVPVFATISMHGEKQMNPCLFVFNFCLSLFHAICVQDADL